LLRYKDTFQTSLDNVTNEDVFISGFTKTYIEKYPYDNTSGTANIYENFVNTNQTEFDLLTQKVRKSYKIVKGYLSS
jgi:hypothetical protein